MLFDFMTQVDSWFSEPEHACPDCGGAMKRPKKGGPKHKRMYRCVYYPKCTGGKHIADHVIAADRDTRSARRQLHKMFERVGYSKKKTEKWLSVYGTHAHIGQMMYDDIIETHVRYEQWRADELRVYIFNQLVNHI